MISNDKQGCMDHIGGSVKRSANWRRQLQTKWPDQRNERAAVALDRLAYESSYMTDRDFARLAPHYSWSSATFADAVSETSRLVGYRGVDSFPDFMNALARILNRSGVAA